ncbi:MG2 domain-containing protein [Bizionia sp.]|uniref:alpha-2-macroglobulin family protein n=1 Tax=Bizionia sp. TaxID=1954480 RepID=UPI003A8F6A03
MLLDEDAQLGIINAFKAQIKSSSFPTKNILKNIIANLYWQYFYQHRYDFYQRTQTAQKVDPSDFRTWDLKTLFKEVHLNFQQSLAEKEKLQKLTTNEFSAIIQPVAATKTYRPSLYDFLANNALDFYKTPENTIAKPTAIFTIDKPMYFADATAFSTLPLETKDSLSLQYQALKIYQDLTVYHLKNNNIAALAFTTLDRLKFVNQNAVFQDKETLLLKALDEGYKRYNNHTIGGLYGYEIVRIYMSKGTDYPNSKIKEDVFKIAEALQICNTIINRFPKSLAAENCRRLKGSITSKTLSIKAEKNVPIGKKQRLFINYKNIETLYFTSYLISKNEQNLLNKIYNLEARVNFIKNLTQTNQWTSKLRNIKDFRAHSTEVITPKFKGGNYLIVVSESNTLNASKIFGSTSVQVTNLALVESHKDRVYRYQVVNRNNGKPIKNASITISNPNRNSGALINKTIKTNKKGFATFKSPYTYLNCEITVAHKKDNGYFGNNTVIQHKKSELTTNKGVENSVIKPFLFTDRSIYRPGQTVYFKTIFVKTGKKNSTPFTNQYVQIKLLSQNRQLVKSIDLKLNEYGSAAGTFTIPDNGLTGYYSFEFDKSEKVESTFYKTADYIFVGNYNNKILVEEYKRPRFQTEFKPITSTFKLNDSVTVSGFAKSYSGTSISQAKVTYKVIRRVELPTWFYWRHYFRDTTPQEISFGETTTNSKGEFNIRFNALPDASISKENLPIFKYEIIADVTDVNGETRSNSTLIKVGYHSLVATLSLPLKINKRATRQSIKITTKNLNNQFVAAKGTVKIFKLQAPKAPLRERAWSAPEYQDISEKEFRKLFPNVPYLEEEANELNWKKGTLVYQSTFDTGSTDEIYFEIGKLWKTGKYSVILESKDPYNQTVKDEQHFSLFDPKSKKVTDNELFSIHTDKSFYNPNESIELKLASASKDLTVTLMVEAKGIPSKIYTIHLNNNTKTLKIPIENRELSSLNINYHFVNYNAFTKNKLRIPIVKQQSSLTLQTTSFRDKLKPGQTETWSFSLKNDTNDGVAAEILASMYDASLDDFKEHQWQFQPIAPKYDYSYNSTRANNSFGSTSFSIKNIKHYYSGYKQLTFDSYNWFGFHLDGNQWRQRRYFQRITQIPKTAIIVESGIFNGTVTGIVVDKNGEPLPNANISIKGSMAGTETNFDGNFSLSAKKGDVLVFSYIGYLSAEVVVGNASQIEVRLIEDANVLDEVVVTGLGISREDVSLGYAMQGKVAGIAIETEKARKDLATVKARKNLNETAFFYPQLTTDKDGNVRFNFTVPEALTQWKLQLLAHTQNLQTTSKTLTAVTQKELMVVPNAPRFLRQGDEITFSAKISNLTSEQLSGFVQLDLTDVITGKEINADLKNTNSVKPFKVDKNGNIAVSWDLSIPNTVQAIQYKIIAKAGDFSDGEQNILPVLSNKMLVTETLPLWVRSNETKTFRLDKLKDNNSLTLKNHKLTLEMTSNPAWYAVQAMPYLMEYFNESSEQTFSKYYANSLASHIVNSNPRIKNIFKSWQSSEALISNLEKNQELKSIVIQETPWLRDAQSETEQKKRIALLFDLNLMQNSQNRAINYLKTLQLNNGGFPWFKGFKAASIFITQHIASGFGHLKKLGVSSLDETAQQLIENAVEFSDGFILQSYSKLLDSAEKLEQKASSKASGTKAAKKFLAQNHLNYTQIQYLYMRSFYKELPLDAKTEQAVAYYKNQAKKYWGEFGLYGQGQIALALFRTDDKVTAKNIIASLKENSINSDELGMYWKKNIPGYYFYEAPIETQALLIEAFSEIENDIETIDLLKTWLLKHKQTNQWKTTKATTEAIYALLLTGRDWISITDMVAVKIGDKKIAPTQLENAQVEAGTGYYKTSWYGKDIRPKMAEVSVTKKGNGIAWGALYWEYFEDLDKITPAETPLKIKKKLFLKVNSSTGKMLKEIKKDTYLKIGDLVTIRIEIRSDRVMEFIHLKDMRASGFEPINVLSSYKRQGTLGYYESTRDAATNFFFDTLPKGVHILEYDVRVNQAGSFSNGITTIQSMYAPEFSSHSEGIRIKSEK